MLGPVAKGLSVIGVVLFCAVFVLIAAAVIDSYVQGWPL